MKEMAVKYREHVHFISQDDKCKVDVGEPGCPVAAVDRGKKVGTRYINYFFPSYWCYKVMECEAYESISTSSSQLSDSTR